MIRRNPFIQGLAAVILTVGVNASAAVTATLSRGETIVGVPVQLQIQADGSANASLPQEIEADGLQIRRRGQQTQVEIVNFRMKTSVIHIYSVLPLKEGTLTIPSINVTVDGKVQRTNALQLRVAAGGSGAGVPQAQPATPGGAPMPNAAAPSSAPKSNERVAFAELVIPKTTAFVGEVIPVEFRFFFNASLPFEIQSRPSLSGEGFTVQRLPDPTRGSQEIDGVSYNVFTFQTAITPLKSGTLELPPVSLDCITQVPMSGSGNLNDLFNQFFSGGGVQSFGQSREITVKSDPAKLVVKPLPREGKPPGFGGAVGEFEIAASADPTTVKDGEPLKLSITISGRGNFDAMGEPKLADADAWRTYPPATTFDPQDNIGYGGAKRFDFMLVAKEDQEQTPVAEFSYFNPGTEKYVTLRSDPIAVQAQSSSSASAATLSSPTTSATAAPSPTAEAVTALTADRLGSPRSFSPWIRRPTAWIINAIALAIVLTFLVAGWIRKHNAGSRGSLARIRKARKSELARLSTLRDSSFLAAASRLVESDAASAGYSIAQEWLDSQKVANELAVAALGQMLAQADEAQFSGGLETTRVSDSARTEVLNALREVRP